MFTFITIQNVVNFFLLLALVKVIKRTHNPFIPAFIYGFASFIYGYLAHEELKIVLLASVLSLGITFIYFWLLDKFDNTLVWWLILLLGLFIALI